MISTDAVADEEELYRRIKNWDGYYKIENGRCRLSSQAFYEKQRRISVNRTHLCDNDPQRVQEEETDAVLSFLAEHVRVVIQGKKEDKTIVDSVVDVEPKPTLDNPAHAEIFAVPDYATNSTFKRLCEMLARLYDVGKAQLLIAPPELREEVKE